MLANAVWQSLITRYVLTPGFDLMGLRVTGSRADGDGQRPAAFRRRSTTPLRIPGRASTTWKP